MRPRIRTASLTGYVDLCRSLVLDPAEMVAAVGMTVADLAASDRWIPAAPAARLLELSAQRGGVEDFALRLAELRRLGTLGPLSVVLRDEPDLRSALALLIAHEPVYNEALHMRMSEDDVLVTINAWLEFGEPAPAAQALDLVMASFVGIVRTLVRREWKPLSVTFTHAAPADPAPYHRLFGPWVRFGQDDTGLIFHVQDLDLPVVISDPSLRPYTHAFLRSVLVPGPTTMATRTAEALELLLPLGSASAEQVSRQLGMSPRQLQRALAQEGQTFSGIVHGVRASLAERHLLAGRFTLTKLSQELGFAAPSALSRWFRQQFGTTPSAWRTAAAAAEAVGGTGAELPAPPRAPPSRAQQRSGEATDAP
jgi:AraC-like DNA-binding protein